MDLGSGLSIPIPAYGLLASGIVLVILYTSFLRSPMEKNTKSEADDIHQVPIPHYYVPFIGHLSNLVFGMDKYLRGLRDNSTEGLFELRLLHTRHVMITNQTLASRIFALRPSFFDTETIMSFFLNVVGGLSEVYKQPVLDSIPDLEHSFSILLREPFLSTMISINCRNLEKAIPSLVSFSSRPIDQNQWERKGEPKLVVDEAGVQSVEINLLPVILDFIGHSATPSIFGTDLLKNYPDLLTDLWEFNNGFFHLAAYLPRWFPSATLAKAYRGRDRVIAALEELQVALDAYVEGRDPGERWENVSDVSEFIKARHRMWREKGIPIPGRVELSNIWAMNANSNFAVFWLLLRILSTPGLLQDIMKEVEPYAQVSCSKTPFGNEEYNLKLNEKALTTSCPLLKATLIECMRLDSATWSLRKLKKDVSIAGDSGPSNFETKAPRYHIKAGAFVEVPFDLHFSDEKYFPAPDEFQPRRHLKKDGSADWGTVRAFGGGFSACKGRLYAEREIITSTVGILTMWNIETADGEPWKIPGHGKATGVCMPKGDVVVRLSKRY